MPRDYGDPDEPDPERLAAFLDEPRTLAGRRHAEASLGAPDGARHSNALPASAVIDAHCAAASSRSAISTACIAAIRPCWSARCRRRRAARCPALVLTFEPHPRIVFRPDTPCSPDAAADEGAAAVALWASTPWSSSRSPAPSPATLGRSLRDRGAGGPARRSAMPSPASTSISARAGRAARPF